MRHIHRLLKFSLYYCCLISFHSLASNTIETPIVSINIDAIAVNVAGIEQAMLNIENQLAQLSHVLVTASPHDAKLTAADKALLKQTITQLNHSSIAMTTVLNSLPKQIDEFNQQLPQLAKSAQAPMANLAQSLSLLNKTVDSLSTQAPELLAQGQTATNNTLDAITLRIMLIAGGTLVLMLALIITSILVLNKKIIQPISQGIQLMNSFPAQQMTTAQLLEQTADKLIRLSTQMNQEIEHKAESKTDAINKADET